MHSCSKEVTGLQSGRLEERVSVTDVALAVSEFCVNILLEIVESSFLLVV